MIEMSSKTTAEIKALSTDAEQTEGLLAVMNYYGVNNLMRISESMALLFLEKVRSGEINIQDYLG